MNAHVEPTVKTEHEMAMALSGTGSVGHITTQSEPTRTALSGHTPAHVPLKQASLIVVGLRSSHVAPSLRPTHCGSIATLILAKRTRANPRYTMGTIWKRIIALMIMKNENDSLLVYETNYSSSNRHL